MQQFGEQLRPGSCRGKLSLYLVGAGLFQINVTVPMNAPTGNLNIQASVGANGSGGNNNGVKTSGDINVRLAVQ